MTIILGSNFPDKKVINGVVKSSLLPVKIVAYLVSIGWLLCLAFLYGWRFLNKICLDVLAAYFDNSAVYLKPF